MAASGSKIQDTILVGIYRKSLQTVSFVREPHLRHTSPIPRPGILPPTLNGRTVSAHVAPWSVERSIEPTFGSHSFVYMPTARYRRFVSTGSVARASIPQSCLKSQPGVSMYGEIWHVPIRIICPICQWSPRIVRVETICPSDICSRIR
jgi:hypothetical protein